MKLTLTALIALVAYAGPSTQGPSVLLAPLFENPEAEVVPDEYIVLLKDGDVHSADFVSSLESAVEGIDLIHVYNQGFAAKLVLFQQFFFTLF